MPIDIGTLAATVVTSFLVPYAKLGFEKLVEELGKKLGEMSAEKSTEAFKKVWERVKGAFTPEEKQVWEQFEKRPEAAQGLVQEMLKEKLEADPELAQALSRLVSQPLPESTSTGAQITNAEVASILDLRGANFQNAQNVRLTGTNITEK
jgi:transketolase